MQPLCECAHNLQVVRLPPMINHYVDGEAGEECHLTLTPKALNFNPNPTRIISFKLWTSGDAGKLMS